MEEVSEIQAVMKHYRGDKSLRQMAAEINAFLPVNGVTYGSLHAWETGIQKGLRNRQFALHLLVGTADGWVAAWAREMLDAWKNYNELKGKWVVV